MVWSPRKGTCVAYSNIKSFGFGFDGIPLEDEILAHLRSKAKIPLNTTWQPVPIIYIYLDFFYIWILLSIETSK